MSSSANLLHRAKSYIQEARNKDNRRLNDCQFEDFLCWKLESLEDKMTEELTDPMRQTLRSVEEIGNSDKDGVVSEVISPIRDCVVS